MPTSSTHLTPGTRITTIDPDRTIHTRNNRAGTVCRGTFEQEHRWPDMVWVLLDNQPEPFPHGFTPNMLRINLEENV